MTPAAVVLMRRSEFRQIAGVASKAPRVTLRHADDFNAEDRKRALSPKPRATVLLRSSSSRRFARSLIHKLQNDRGIAAHLEWSILPGRGST